MAYSDKVVDHYNNPRNVGSLPKEDPNVGTGLVGAPERATHKLLMNLGLQDQVSMIHLAPSPHSGAPTRPVPTLGSSFGRLPTLRGLL